MEVGDCNMIQRKALYCENTQHVYNLFTILHIPNTKQVTDFKINIFTLSHIFTPMVLV